MYIDCAFISWIINNSGNIFGDLISGLISLIISWIFYYFPSRRQTVIKANLYNSELYNFIDIVMNISSGEDIKDFTNDKSVIRKHERLYLNEIVNIMKFVNQLYIYIDYSSYFQYKYMKKHVLPNLYRFIRDEFYIDYKQVFEDIKFNLTKNSDNISTDDIGYYHHLLTILCKYYDNVNKSRNNKYCKLDPHKIYKIEGV